MTGNPNDYKDELPDPDKTGFYMMDPLRCERIDPIVFGVRWNLWTVLLQGTDDRGFIGHTQESLAILFQCSDRQIRNHYAVFKKAKLIEKARDSEGRIRFRVCPENFYNFKRSERNEEVRKRQGNVIHANFSDKKTGTI